MRKKRIFDKPCGFTKNRFKNKTKKELRSEIVEMLSRKEFNKDDLIVLWQILKYDA